MIYSSLETWKETDNGEVNNFSDLPGLGACLSHEARYSTSVMFTKKMEVIMVSPSWVC